MVQGPCAEEKRYKTTWLQRVNAEIGAMNSCGEFFSAVLSHENIAHNKSAPLVRGDEMSVRDCVHKIAGAGLLLCRQTPATFLDRTAAKNEEHVVKTARAILGCGQKFLQGVGRIAHLQQAQPL